MKRFRWLKIESPVSIRAAISLRYTCHRIWVSQFEPHMYIYNHNGLPTWLNLSLQIYYLQWYIAYRNTFSFFPFHASYFFFSGQSHGMDVHVLLFCFIFINFFVSLIGFFFLPLFHFFPNFSPFCTCFSFFYCMFSITLNLNSEFLLKRSIFLFLLKILL